MKKEFYTILFALLALSVGLYLIGESQNTGIISNIGSTILSSVILTYILEFFFKRFSEEKNEKVSQDYERLLSKYNEELNQKIEQMLSSNTIVNDATAICLSKIYPNRDAFLKEFVDITKQAIHKISIVGESLGSIIEIQENKEALQSALSNGIQVQLALLSLDSYAINDRYIELGVEPKLTMGYHIRSINEFTVLSSYSGFEFRFFRNHPKILLIIIDDTTIYVQHYSYGLGGREAPVYKYYGQITNSTISMYNIIFSNIWRDTITREEMNKKWKKNL